MIDEALFKTDYLGKDGFIWWIGQVADAKSWKAQSSHANFQDSQKANKNWPERCKVRIIGYHTFRTTELEDKDLPWAHIMMDPAFGSGQGGEGVSSNLTGGEVCFGFFLDGDDAQQPVLVGVIHRHKNVQNFPKDEDFAFRPFTGHSSSIPSTKREAPSPTGPKEAPSPITPSIQKDNPGIEYKNGKIGFSTSLDLGVSYNPILKYGDTLWPGKQTLAHLAFNKKVAFTYTKPSGCRDNMIGQITQLLQDFIGLTNGIQKYADVYIDPILNTVVDIRNSIRSVARSIAGILRLVINSIRGALIKYTINLFKDFIALRPPPEQTILGQSVKNIIDKIFCLIEKLIPTIISLLEQYLTKMVDTVINAPRCAVEQFTAGILATVMDTIEGGIDTIISGINWLTGGLSSVFNILNQASSMASSIYNFIGCDNLKCKKPSKWVSAFAMGPSNVDSDNWEKMVGSINIVKGAAKDLKSVENAIMDLSLYNQGSSYGVCNQSVNNPTTQDELSMNLPGIIRSNPIPPIVDIYGDGLGGSLIPIINANGSLVSIEIESGGVGYTYPPILTVVDKSGYGSNATAETKIDSDGTITQVVITNPGGGYAQGNSDISKVCVRELTVVRPGIGYTSGDTLTDGINTYYPIISPINGAIISVKPLSVPYCGFTSLPSIFINTTTGVGAKILAIVSLQGTTGDEKALGIGSSVINVVDCV